MGEQALAALPGLQVNKPLLLGPDAAMTRDVLLVPAAADMLHDFMGSVQSAQSKLTALCTCVEDYVEKMLFLEQYVANEKAMDAACNEVRVPCGRWHV